MKKIGIITHYCHSINYGGNLQAYALCKVLNNMGYDAEHYKNILIAPMAYGQSLTILALVEALQNDKKSI